MIYPLRDWQRIRQSRYDLTDYVIHWTKGRFAPRVTAFEVLVEIARCGYLKPTFAPRRSTVANVINRTIKGPHPAVCFTEQPLWAYLISSDILTDPDRYKKYGLFLSKSALYDYGGRPVIYGDDATLGQAVTSTEPGYDPGKEIFKNGLHLDEQYRWAIYSPNPGVTARDYPLDFSHEREWRARGKTIVETANMGQASVVPIFLPRDPWYVPERYRRPDLPSLGFLVRTQEEVADLKAILLEIANTPTEGIPPEYYECLDAVPVLALNDVRDRVNCGDKRWGKVETIPWSEIDN